MTKANSTAPRARRKPRRPKPQKKPHPDFPLTRHPSGQWCKKVRGKLHYFGAWSDDPEGERALDRWLADKDDLLAGRVPRSRRLANEPTLGDLVSQFLVTKSLLRDGGELSPHTWDAYSRVCDELLGAFGAARLLTDLLPEDFQGLRARWQEKWGPVRLGNEINRARVVFNYAYKNRLIPAPMLYGEGFRRPTRKVLRLARAEKGPRMFEASELKRMINRAEMPMKAMLLLAINAALGNADVARLRFPSLDLKSGWLNYPRGKTGVMRRCPLWPETIKAINAWRACRPSPKDPDAFDIVFITVRGNAWDKSIGDRAVTHECRKLLDELGITGSRNFYAIRHTFETIAGESKDQVAVDAIMGHVDSTMAGEYRERISDDRLWAAVNVVRDWLYAKPVAEEGTRKKPPRLQIVSTDEGNTTVSA